MLDWSDDTRLVVDGTSFWVNSLEAGFDGARDALVIDKPRWVVERYDALRAEIAPENIFELGIYQGGSTAFFALLFRPRRLVAIDLKHMRVPALDVFVERHDLSDVVHPYYSVDQADRLHLEQIICDEFGDEPLDLVVDDASHLLAPTTASFDVLFPRLRPGGLFVIEDWSWDHHIEFVLEQTIASTEGARERLTQVIDDGTATPTTGYPMSRLVVQLVLTAAYAPDIVAEVRSLRHGWVAVTRGDRPLDPATFDISQCYGALGRAVLRD